VKRPGTTMGHVQGRQTQALGFAPSHDKGEAQLMERMGRTRYKSYLLRVWQRRDVNGCEWAGSLEQIRAGAEWRFNTLEQLLTQLRRLAEADARLEEADQPPAPQYEPHTDTLRSD
jgi:hypothetical protein